MKPIALIAVTALTVLNMGACATQSAHVSTEDTQAVDIQSVSDLLNAQLQAVTAGDIERASADFAAHSVFSGPELDEVATDAEAKALATRRFKKLHAEGFKPSKPLMLIGGEDTDTVRWAGLRFGSKGQLWTVTTLLTGPAPWQIVAQSWDRPEDDQLIIEKAHKGALSKVGGFQDSLIPNDVGLVTWIDARRSRPTEMQIEGPLRGDTFGIGSAGEYVQSDEALLLIQARQRALYDAGHLAIDPLDGAGRVLRLTPDRAAGVALYHTGIIVETPQGEVTLPMRALAYFLLQSQGPRLIGGHFMATP